MSKMVLIRTMLCLRTLLAAGWLFLSLAILVPVATLAMVVDRGQRLHDLFSVAWAKGILLLVGVRVRCQGADQLSRAEHYVVVANHQGMLDIPALVVALQPRTAVRFVAKRSLFRVPVLGWGMRIFGHIPLDRRGVKNSRPWLIRAQEDVRRRWSVIFFPEGTRTYTGEMGAFKTGAFHIAARARVRILPVTIVGSWEKLPRQHLFAIALGTIHVHVHAPVEPLGEESDKVHSTAEQCRRQIERLLPRIAAEPGFQTTA